MRCGQPRRERRVGASELTPIGLEPSQTRQLILYRRAGGARDYAPYMLRLLARSRWAKAATRGVPVARLLFVAEIAMLASRHLGKLERAERLLLLAAHSRGRPRSLSASERLEFVRLLAALEPRLFLGTAMRRLSPVPLPKRLLYGRRGSPARAALTRGR